MIPARRCVLTIVRWSKVEVSMGNSVYDSCRGKICTTSTSYTLTLFNMFQCLGPVTSEFGSVSLKSWGQ